MVTIARIIVNEHGHKISIAVSYDRRGVTVTATGPHSHVEHTWTPAEVETLRELLDPIHVTPRYATPAAA